MITSLLFQQILHSNATKYKFLVLIFITKKNSSHWCTHSQSTYRQISDYHTYCSQKQHLRFLKSKDKTELYFSVAFFCTLQSFLPSPYCCFPRLCDSLLSNSIQLQTLKRQRQKTKRQRNMGQDQQLKQLIQMNFRVSNPAGRNSHTPLSFP